MIIILIVLQLCFYFDRSSSDNSNIAPLEIHGIY